MGFVRFHFMNSNSQFESIPRTSNSRGSLQSSQQYASKYQFEPLVHYSSSKESLQSLQLNSLKCKFETVAKHMNPRGFLQRAKPYSSKCQFENGANAPEFEPFVKTKAINPEKGEFETEIDKFHSEDAVTVIKKVVVKTSQTENKTEKPKFNTITTKTANEKFKPESREELNSNIENKSKTKNKQITKTKTKSKATPPTIQKFSSHIKFIDYIPTHELITYRHLFAYGFYVE